MSVAADEVLEPHVRHELAVRGALAVLGSQGYSMPDTQLRRVLGREYGKGLRSPSPETIFLHRKLVGTLLISARLHTWVNVHAASEKYLPGRDQGPRPRTGVRRSQAASAR